MSYKNPKRSSDRNVLVDNVVSEIVPYHAQRTALTFCAGNGIVAISSSNDVTITTGLRIINGVATQPGTPFTICQCDAGDWVKGPLYAIADGLARNLFIIEGFEPAGAGEMTNAET